MSVNTSDKKEKEHLRAHFRALRKTIPARLHTELSRQISGRIFNDERVRAAETIACYDAFDGEVDLETLYEELSGVTRAPRLVFPVHTRGLPLTFHEAHSWRSQRGSYRRPIGPQVALSEIDLILAPGVAFTSNGIRLGFGGGYYDRTFPSMSLSARTKEAETRALKNSLCTSETICFGVAFSLQLTSTLPYESWDIQVDTVVSELGWSGRPASSV